VDLIERAARDIINSRNAIALTGAGISVESGIEAFRGSQGLWAKYDPEEYATIQAFIDNPEKVWNMFREVLETIINAKPNPAHYSLAELENMGYLKRVITQNVDGLHQEAGNKNVIEFHGNNRELVCLRCNSRYSMNSFNWMEVIPRCKCTSILKPAVVFFGEPIPWDALTTAQSDARKCDLIMVIGTSAVVSPAREMPVIAKQNGAKVIEINIEETSLTYTTSDYIIKGSSGIVLPGIVNKIKEIQ